MDRQSTYLVPFSLREAFIREAIKSSYNVEKDELDCKKNFCRQSTDKTVEEIIQMCLAKTSMFTFIRRKDYSDILDYYEVCASTMGTEINYFLWIKLKLEVGDMMIKKYHM